MKSKLINLFLLLTTIEGLFALAFYLLIPSETQTNLLFRLSLSRLILAALLVASLLSLIFCWVKRLTKKENESHWLSSIDEKFKNGPDLLFVVSSLSLTAFVFSIEAYFLT